MTPQELINPGWVAVVERLGGADFLEREAREIGAFERARAVKSAVDMLRLVLSYCLGEHGLRLTAAWAEAIGLASFSNVALLKRLRKSTPWLQVLVARLLAAPRAASAMTTEGPAGGRLIRLVDATVVAKAGRAAREAGGVWRVHAVYDLPAERFSAFEVTDEREGERLDRAGVVPGEIRIADRAYLQPDRIAALMDAGADVVIRAPWNGARWLDADGERLDLVSLLVKAKRGVQVIDRPDLDGRSGTAADRSASRGAAQAARGCPQDTRQSAPAGRAPGQGVAARDRDRRGMDDPRHLARRATYPAAAIGELYRLRWRIEIAFKHLKSGVGLAQPPGTCPDVAKAHILCHLLEILLTEPLLIEHLGDSPRRLAA